MHLVIPDKIRREVLLEERNNMVLKHAAKTSKFEGEKKKSWEQMVEEARKKNFDAFYGKYNEMREQKIEDMEQFNVNAKGRTKIANPDMTCCSMFLSLCMFCLSIGTFYSARDFNNEYFNRQLIYQKLVHPGHGFKSYSDVTTIGDLKDFVERTIGQELYAERDYGAN